MCGSSTLITDPPLLRLLRSCRVEQSILIDHHFLHDVHTLLLFCHYLSCSSFSPPPLFYVWIIFSHLICFCLLQVFLKKKNLTS